MKKITWLEFETIRKIKEYADVNCQKTPDNKMDFYNLYTGLIHCGICNKVMRPFRSLFHYHIWNKKQNNQ